MEEIQKVIDMKELGRRFKLIRQRLGMTQTEVGKQLNTTQLMICRVEKGENVLSPLLLSLLAFYSQSVSMDYLFSRNFDIDDENVFNKDFALNSIVKAKLNSLRDDVLGKLGKTEEEIRRACQGWQAADSVNIGGQLYLCPDNGGGMLFSMISTFERTDVET